MMEYPLLSITRGEPAIYFHESPAKMGITSQKNSPFLDRALCVYDSLGDNYELTQVGECVRDWPLSFRHLQPMYRVALVERIIGHASLDAIKALCLRHIEPNMHYWELLDDLETLTSRINNCQSLPELYMMFR